MKFSYIIIVAFLTYLLVKFLLSLIARRKVKGIMLAGMINNNFLKLFITVIFVALILQLNLVWIFVRYILVLIIIAIGTFNDRFYLGKNGIKLGDKFIPKENIQSYYIIPEKVGQIQWCVKGRKNLVKVIINKRFKEQPLEEILNDWFRTKSEVN